MVVLQLLLNALIAGSVIALLGVGVQLVYATSRVLHLAHGAVVLAAGYALAEGLRRGLAFPMAVALGIVAATALGVGAERFVYAPMRRRGATSATLLLASLALLTIATNVLLIRYGAGVIRPALPFANTPWVIGGAAITPLQAALTVTTMAVLAALVAGGAWTRAGVAIRAVTDHPIVAAVVGIAVDRMRLLAAVIAAVIAGVAGTFLAFENALTPEIATLYAVLGFAAAVVGGQGSMAGAVAAGFLIGGAKQVGAYAIPGGWHEAVVFGLVFAFLIWRPQGLFGRKAT